MKKLLPALAAMFVFLLYGISVFAQQYQPFRKGLTYHYIAQDSIYSMRIDSAKVVNGDSVFVFNAIARKGASSAINCTPTWQGWPEYSIHPNNQFGAQMRKKANGDYIFKTHQGAEFLLKTKVAIGQSWTAFTTPAITVTLTSRTLEPVKNTISDSVITYSLSNGKTIKLSKNYGFLKAPNLAQYSDIRFNPKELEFYALPEKGLGHTISSPFAIFDFQPGDKFGYYDKNEKMNGSICSERWIRQEVKTRQSSANGDTIYYTIEDQKLIKTYGHPSAPTGFCQGTSSTNLLPVNTITLIITKDYAPLTSTLTQGYTIGSSTFHGSLVTTGIIRKQQYSTREQMHFMNLSYNTCTQEFIHGLDSDTRRTYAVGLGQTGLVDFSSNSTRTFTLECYTKGTETYGNCRSLAQIMATEEELNKKPMVQAFPNPFTNELTLTFGETSGNMQLSLLNTLGQIVWQQETSASANAELKLQLPELPKGMYVLQASQKGKIYTTRLVKQ